MTKKLSSLLMAVTIVASPVCLTQAQEVPKTWTKNCFSCHGKDGKGATKAGRKAQVKDLTDATYQATFSDEQAFKSIKEGLTVEGKEKMKPSKDKLTDDEIKQLIAFVRAFLKS